MSKNRDNIVWQSKDKTWNLGFYSWEPVNEDSEDYDSEWDVEYDFSKFAHAFIGHPTPESARAAWPGPNPGSTTTVAYSKGKSEELDRMAQFCLHPELEVAAQKKENARLKREHQKALKQKFVENKNFQSDYVAVGIKYDDEPWTRLGGTSTYTGYLKREGDWLTIEGKKVINTANGRLNPKLHSIEVRRFRW